MLTFTQHLHKEIPFLVEAVEDFVNRYIKLHAEHPKVQNSPEEARKLIAAAHPHAQGHHEAVYLTRSLLDGEYDPEKDDAMMRSDLGAWRKFSNKHKDKIKSGLTKTQIPEISSLSRKDLAGQLSVDEKNPLPGLEEYHIGTIEHPELGTVDVHHVLHRDMQKKFPKHDSRKEEYARISRIKSNHCPKIPGKEEGQRMCTISSGEHIENYAQDSGYFFFTHRDRGKLNSVPQLIMGAGHGDRAGLVNTYNEKIDSKTADSIHNQVRKLLPIEKKIQYDMRYTSSDAKPYSFEELKGIIDNVVDKHKKISEKRMIERHGKDFDFEKGLGIAETYDRNNRILDDLSPHIVTLNKTKDQHNIFEIENDLKEGDPDSILSPDRKKQIYPYASLIEKPVLSKLGRHLHDTLVGFGRKTSLPGEHTPIDIGDPVGMKDYVKSAVKLISEPEDVRHVLKFHLDRTKIPANEENAYETREAKSTRNKHLEVAMVAAGGNHQLGLDEANKMIEHFKTSPIAQDRNTNHQLIQAEFLGSIAKNPSTSGEDLHKVIDLVKTQMLGSKQQSVYFKHHVNSIISNPNFDSSHANSLLDHVQSVMDNPESTTDDHYHAGKVLRHMTQSVKYSPRSNGEVRLRVGQSPISGDNIDRIYEMLVNKDQKIKDDLAEHGHTIETARRDPNFQPGGMHAHIMDKRGYYDLNQGHKEEVLDTLYKESVMSPELIHKHIDLHLDKLQAAANLKKYDPNAYNQSAKNTMYYNGSFKVTRQEEESMSRISDILSKQVNVNDDHIRHLLTSPFFMENHDSDIVKANGGVGIQATQHPAIKEYTARMLADHPSRHIRSFARTSHIIPRNEAMEHMASGSVNVHAQFNPDIKEKAPTIEGIMKQRKEGVFPRGLYMPDWLSVPENYHHSVIPKTQETSNIPQQANENKSMDFISLLNEELLFEAKVDQFVNRYMNYHNDHPMVKEDPEKARSLIAAAHGIGDTHAENVYLTDQLLAGAYKPNEDEETMRAHVGMVRKAVKKGHMEHEDILDHNPASLGMFFNDLEKKDPDFEMVEKPKKGNPPIANLEQYKIGTVMPHPETTTKRIDKKLPMHVYHVTHDDVSASGRNPAFEFNRISKNIMQNCPKDSTICVRSSGEHLKRYSEGHGFFLYVQGGRVVRAHGYKDQGIVNHKNYPVPQEEQKHLFDETSKLLSGSKKMTYDLHTSIPAEAYQHLYDDGDFDEGERSDAYDPGPIQKARENIQKKFAGVTPLQLKAVFSGEFKKHKKERQRGTFNPVYFPDRLAWNAPQRAEFTRKKSPFVDAVYDLLDKHFDPENPSPIKDTPFAHPNFIRHVVRYGRTDPKLIRSYIKSDNFNSDDVDHFLRKIKSSPIAQKISSGEPENSLSASFRTANAKHSKLFSILPSLIGEAQKRKFLTQDHIDTIFDLREKLPPNTTASSSLLDAKRTLLRTKHPLITADHIDKYIDGFPSEHASGTDLGAAFEHPSHTREHVDRILSGDFRGARENKRLMTYPAFNIEIAHRAFKHSPHIREDEIVHALSGKDLSDDPNSAGPSFKPSNQHNIAVGKATGLLENPILKPHHISIAINNIDRYKSGYDGRPHSISEPIRHQNLVSHPSFNMDHEHQALATGNRKLIEHIGATTKNPDIMHRIIAMHERKPETDRYGVSRDPRTGLIITEPPISMIGAVMRNPNIDQSHIDAAAQHPELDEFERGYNVDNARNRLRRKTQHASLEEPKSRKISTYHATKQRLASGAITQITNPPRPRVGRYGTPEYKMRKPRRMEEGFLSFLDFVLQ